MAQKKAHEVDAWLARPASETVAVLIYGPDRGLVSERAAAFAGKTGLALDDPFSVIRYEAGELESEPGKLLDEAGIVPMFGGHRLLWIRNAGNHKGLTYALKLLLDSPPPDAIILVEAGDLKKGAGLRDAFERAPSAMALPCYVDEERTIDLILDQELTRHGKTIDADARMALRRRLGGDRLATRGEIEKLVLYVGDGSRISIGDVDASTGDVSGFSVDQAIDAALAGNRVEVDRSLQRAFSSGAHAQAIIGAAMRQFQALELLRREMDHKGANAASVVASARPPVFFARKRLIEQALSAWSGAAIARMTSRLSESLLETRRQPELAHATIGRVFLSIAAESARGRRGR